MRSGILALAAVLIAAAPDPYGIYAKARSVWEQAQYPPGIAYTVVVRADDGGVTRTNHYHSFYDARRDRVRVDPVSDEERLHPHVVPPGPSFGFLFIPVGKPEARTDILGIPELAPNYSFGISRYAPQGALTGMPLVRQIRKEFHDPAPLRPVRDAAPGGLKEIASVEAAARNYTIVLAGTESVNGHSDYHLVLRPIREPKKYRLRDLWIDERSFFTDRLSSDGNFVDGPGPGIPWTISFRPVDGAPYITTEAAGGPLSFPGAVYRNAMISFEDLRRANRTPILDIATYVTSHGQLKEP